MQHARSTPAERRAHRRRQVADSRAWVVVRVAGGRPMRVGVRDISIVGVLVEVPLTLLTDWPGLRAEVAIELHLDDTHYIEHCAKVAWMGGDVFDHQRRYRAGLEFCDLPEHDQQVVEDWMEHLPE